MSWREFFTEQARWDESHTQPLAELVQDGATPIAAYSELRDQLADPEHRLQWIANMADEIASEGAPSGEAAYKVWADAYLRIVKDRVYAANPSCGELSDEDEAAVEKYLEFHRYDAKHLDTVDIQIPEIVYKGGKGGWVTYRSRKVDPSTLVRPKRPVDYIHEFDAGVNIYRPDAGEGRERTTVPDEFRHVGALVKLGMCLGFEYKNAGGVTEAQTSRPLPELACCINARGESKCLYVIQDRRRVIALIWGGALGVFARGIDG